LRWFYVMYVPMIGWAIYFAILLVIARDWILREVRRFSPVTSRQWAIAHSTLAVCIAFGVTHGLTEIEFVAQHVDPMRKIIQETRNDFMSLQEPLPKGSRILLLHSRWPDDAWGPLMISRLLYRDPDLWLDRPTMLPTHKPLNPATIAEYDRVIDFDGRRLFIAGRRSGNPESGISYRRVRTSEPRGGLRANS
jgi:hypothetical protein